MSEAAVSSSAMVPRAEASVAESAVPAEAPLSVTVNVSSSSAIRSWRVATVTVAVVAFASNASVAAAGV